MLQILKVGVIGVGYLGAFHARKYADMDGVELVGVSDKDIDRARIVAEECSTRAFSDYRELLKQVDTVSVVVSTSSHHEVGLACIEHGVHMLVEKPMTVTLDEADDLIRGAAEKNLALQVGLIERYNPAVLAVRRYITEPLFIESHRIGPFKGRGIDVDVVLDLMIHDIDIVFSIVSSPLATIHAVGVPVATTSTDIANTRLIFENGCTANVTVSRISMETMRRMRIFQPFSYVSLDFAKKEFMVIRPRLIKDGFMPRVAMDADGVPEQDVIKENFQAKDQLHDELLDFVTSVRMGRKPAVSGEDGRRVLAVALEIIEQTRRNREACRGVLQKALQQMVF